MSCRRPRLRGLETPSLTRHASSACAFVAAHSLTFSVLGDSVVKKVAGVHTRPSLALESRLLSPMFNPKPIQSALAAEHLGGWLVHDFRHSNAVLARLLPHEGPPRHLTRRVALYVPLAGPATLLVSPLDEGQFAAEARLGTGVLNVRVYNGWRGLHEALREVVGGAARVAMEYAPGAALPVVSVVDAGTIELVRSFGVEVVSSADLIQATAAAWPESSVGPHLEAACEVDGIKNAAFDLIRARLRTEGSVLEHEVADFIREQFKGKGLQWPDGPIVAATHHSSDPHYAPDASRPHPIRRGDLVMIDLWARRPGDEHLYSDVTWMGVATGSFEVSSRLAPRLAVYREVFDVVKNARDAALKAAQDAWSAGRAIQGWELDEAARQVIIAAGLERGIKHRTGHSLSPGAMVHGLGMNLDNIETRDTRRMMPRTGFTIEPGVYIPNDPKYGFGVRSEINVYVDPVRGPVVTSGVQTELIECG